MTGNTLLREAIPLSWFLSAQVVFERERGGSRS
jgi:hypothetical protein